MIGGYVDRAVDTRGPYWQADVWRNVASRQEARAKTWRAAALVIAAVSVVSHAMIWWVCR